MSTQAKNVIDREGYDSLRESVKGGAEAVVGGVESFVESLHSVAVAPTQELMDTAPLLKAVAVGYAAGVLTVLATLMLT